MNILSFSSKFKLQSFFLISIIVGFILAHSLFGCSWMGREGMAIKPNARVHKEIKPNARVHKEIKPNARVHKESFLINGGKMKEGFTGANTNYGESSSYRVGDYSPVDTSMWGEPNLVVNQGKPLSAGVQAILARPNQPVPLPEGENLLFANTPFSPQCCPNVYSNGSGCACMTTKQYNYLQNRGNNNVPYSEY
jgi:hypothetical protein